ncbi:hypothetical protein PV327_007064 [Microctonus hyperodae]|uniref:C2H2-type domain-containing protein n=1 Tax=Microctonus hyperodae TaxID=165561 RepID=A0AA39KJ90_MICHY|nr:hypothetical protein PV327_007064 [Microctonus hyperodae]
MAEKLVFPRCTDDCKHFERGKILLCFICPNAVSKYKNGEIWDTHVRDPEHLLVVESFHESFNESRKSILCNICSKSCSRSNVKKHAITHKLSPWHKPENLYSQFFMNFIAQFRDQYYCHVCEVKFSFWYFAFKHILNSNHQVHRTNRLNRDTDNILPANASQYELLIKNSVFANDTFRFKCMLCPCIFSGFKNFNEHINGYKHQSQKEKFLNKLPEKKEDIVVKSNARRKRKRYRGNDKKASNVKSTLEPKKIEEKTNKPCLSQKIMPKNITASETKVETSRNVTNFVGTSSSSNNTSSLTQMNIEHPLHQFIHITGIPEQDKTIRKCIDCGEMVAGYVELHVHSTKHVIEKRFPNKDSNMHKNQSNAPTTSKNTLIELNANNANRNRGKIHLNENNNVVKKSVTPLDVYRLAEKFSTLQTSFRNEKTVAPCSTIKEPAVSTVKSFGTSKLQFFEKLSEKLSAKNVCTIKDPIEIDSPVVDDKILLEPFVNDESSSTSDLVNLSRSKYDVYYGTEYDYIYNIDNKQLKDIKHGLILSFIPDKNYNIYYCMICRKSVKNSLENIYEHLSNSQHNSHLKRMEQDHIRSKTFPNVMSDSRLAIQFMEDQSDSYVKCHACDRGIENDIDYLQQHINDDDHRKNCENSLKNSIEIFKSLKTRMFRDWYNVQNYWCVLCSIQFVNELSFGKHLLLKDHEQNCQLYKSSNQSLMFDFCTTCATLWFGFQCTFSYHSECKMHVYHAQDKFYCVSELPKKVLELLSKPEHSCNELIMKMDYNLDNEKLKEEMLLSDLKKLAQKDFPRAEVHPFGSRVSGLRSKNSDLDVFIDCNKTYNKGDSCAKKTKEYLQIIERSLKKYPDVWKIDKTITENVRIPIIKIHHKPTDIECDISVKNGLSAENTKLIKNYITMFPLCRNLIIFMKKWINDCDLGGNHGINSYTIAWMIIYYLQYKNILPSVAELIRLNGKSKVIDTWETGVIEQFNVQSPQENFIQLVKGAFIFYSEFDYKCEVICPLIGKTVNKQSFSMKPLILPRAMAPYERYLKLDKSEPFCTGSPMCIQDPFELSHNLTKSVKKFTVYQLKTFCLLSAEKF